MMNSILFLNPPRKLYFTLTLLSSLNLACQGSKPKTSTPAPSAPAPSVISTHPTPSFPPNPPRPAHSPRGIPQPDPSLDLSSTSSSRRSSISEAEPAAIPAPLPSAHLVNQLYAQIGTLAQQERLTELSLVGPVIMNLHSLILTNEELLESIDPQWLEPRLQPIVTRLALRNPDGSFTPSFNDYLSARDGSDRLFTGLETTTAAFQTLQNQTTQLILDAQNYRRTQLLRPFRERMIPTLLPYMEEIHAQVYEQLFRPNVARLELPIDIEINTPELGLAEASATGTRCTEQEWTDAYQSEGAPLPDTTRREGEWEARTRMALNVWMNHLQEGHFMAEEIQAILRDLVDSGAIPANYWFQLQTTDRAEDSSESYPLSENRLLAADLLASENLSLEVIRQTFDQRMQAIPQMIQDVLTLSARLHPEAPETEDQLANLPYAKLQSKLSLLQAEQEGARIEAEQAAHNLRVDVAAALGDEALTPEILAAEEDAALVLRLRARYISLFQQLNPNHAGAQARAERTAQQIQTRNPETQTQIQVFITEIERLNTTRQQENRARAAEIASRPEREAAAREAAERERREVDTLRPRVIAQLGQDQTSLARANAAQTRDDLRTLLVHLYAQRLAHNRRVHNFSLARQNEIQTLLRSTRLVDQTRAQISQLAYDSTLEEMLTVLERPAASH